MQRQLPCSCAWQRLQQQRRLSSFLSPPPMLFSRRLLTQVLLHMGTATQAVGSLEGSSGA